MDILDSLLRARQRSVRLFDTVDFTNSNVARIRRRPRPLKPMPDEPPHFSRSAQELIAALRRLPSDASPRMRKRPTLSLGPLIEELLVKNQIGRASPEQAI